MWSQNLILLMFGPVSTYRRGGGGGGSVRRLQAGDVHLHPVIEGEDGGGAGAAGPLLHVADALVEVFPAGGASGGRRRGRLRLSGLLLPLQGGGTPRRAVAGSRRLPLPVGVDGGVRRVGLGGPGPVNHRLVAGLLLGARLALLNAPAPPPGAPAEGAREGLGTVVFHGGFLLLGLAHDGVGVCDLREESRAPSLSGTADY